MSKVWHILIATLATFLTTLVLWRNYHKPQAQTRCTQSLTQGHWSHDLQTLPALARWQASGCINHQYNVRMAEQCFSNHTLYFIGDSVARQIFWTTASKLDKGRAAELEVNVDKHRNIDFIHGAIELKFLWDPFLDRNETLNILRHTTASTPHDTNNTNKLNAGLFLCSGLWYLKRYGDAFPTPFERSLNTIESNIRSFASGPKDNDVDPPVIMLSPPMPVFDRLSPGRAFNITYPRTHQLLDILRNRDTHNLLVINWALNRMSSMTAAAMQSDGLHATVKVADMITDILINTICNQKLFGRTHKAFSSCCTHAPQFRWLPAMVVSTSLVLFAWMYLRVRTESSKPIQRLRFQALACFLIVVGYSWVADRTTVLGKVNKPADERSFTICTTVILGVSMVRLRRCCEAASAESLPDKERSKLRTASFFLSREQTEEWKGWMQIVILFYHFFGMSRVLWVYIIVRILVASYLFLTGYGHAMYFVQRRDFSLRRTVAVLSRLNLLACFLAFVMGNNYDFYYFPGLASLWYLITYTTFWTAKSTMLSTKEGTVRILVSAFLLRSVLSWEGPLSAFLRLMNYYNGPSINPHEFFFRIKLDVFVPYLGMLLALFQTKHEQAILARLTAVWSTSAGRISANIALHFGWTITMVIYIILSLKAEDKYQYNHIHPFISSLPIVAYVIGRNSCTWARHRTAPILRWLGRISLETYVLQYHIWLAADTKGLLRFGVIDDIRFGGPTVTSSWSFWLENILVTLVFLYASNACTDAASLLMEWFVSADDDHISKAQSASRPGYRRQVRVLAILTVLWLGNVTQRTFSG